MATPRCTRHPEHRRRNGRCLSCRSEANCRYSKKRTAAYQAIRKHGLEALLATT